MSRLAIENHSFQPICSPQECRSGQITASIPGERTAIQTVHILSLRFGITAPLWNPGEYRLQAGRMKRF